MNPEPKLFVIRQRTRLISGEKIQYLNIAAGDYCEFAGQATKFTEQEARDNVKKISAALAGDAAAEMVSAQFEAVDSGEEFDCPACRRRYCRVDFEAAFGRSPLAAFGTVVGPGAFVCKCGANVPYGQIRF